MDANDRIGIGHMMRCFSIAKALRQKGCEATFFVADRTSARLAAEHGYGYVCLNSDYDHLDVEADMLIEIMRERGIDERIVHATASHGYSITVDVKPEHEMEKVLYAVDELTGLIGASALMLPTKSVQDLELKSVKKKFKNLKFAAGCSREVIQRGADMLGWDLDTLIEKTILAMRTIDPEV